MKINVFCCSTKYHILLSALLAHRLIGEQCIMVVETTGFKGEENLVKSYGAPIFNKVLIVHETELFVKGVAHNINYKSYLTALVESKYPQILDLKKEIVGCTEYRIFICEDAHPFVRYFIFNFNHIIMLEEGRSIYKKRGTKENKLKQFIKYRLLGINRPRGRDKKIEEIWVQFPENLPEDIAYKGKKLELRKLMDAIYGTPYFTTLLSMLGMTDVIYKKVINLVEEKDMDYRVLLITQPLSEDGYLTESKKLSLYSNIIRRYVDNECYKLYIKCHPRETTNYRTIFPEAFFIDNSFPLELLNFVIVPGKKVFDLAITIDSTAVLNIEEICIKKVMVGYCELTKELANKYQLE